MRWQKYVAAAVCGLVILVALTVVFFPRSITMPMKGGYVVRIVPAPYYRIVTHIVTSTKCVIYFDSSSSPSNTVELAEAYFNSPILVVQSTNVNTFWCIYDNDVDWQLLRINPTHPFRPIPKHNPIQSLVLRSTCEVERVVKADTNDWEFVAATLESMSSSQYVAASIHLPFIVTSQKDLVTSLRHFGDQGQYDGETIMPSDMQNK
jgi:hypothetical protein